MKCQEAKELLKSLETGELCGEEARAVRMHFASCTSCAAELTPAQWVEIAPALDGEIEPSEQFAVHFHARLQARPSSWLSRVLLWGRPRQLAAAGALAALVLAGIFAVKYPDSESEQAVFYSDIEVAENLPLLKDMAVINDLDLLEDFDTIDSLPDLMKEAAIN